MNVGWQDGMGSEKQDDKWEQNDKNEWVQASGQVSSHTVSIPWECI